MNVEKTRSILIKILLGTLIATSVVAVGVILIGSASDLMWRVIWTFIAGVIYVGILLAILSTVQHSAGTKSRSTLFIINSLLALTCASYLTSMLSVWTVIDGDLPWRIHLAFIVMLGGILYAKPLIDVEEKNVKLKPYIYANYGFIALTCALFAVAIISPPEWRLWDGFVGRLIAASVVINVTLSMVITVMHYLYLQQHPDKARPIPARDSSTGQPLAPTAQASKPMSPWIIVLIVIAAVLLLPSLLFGVLGLVFGALSGIISY